MNHIRLVVILVGLVIILEGCGSSTYVNSKYTFERKNPLILAISPVGPQTCFADTAFAKIYYDKSGRYQVVDPGQIRTTLVQDQRLMSYVTTIVTTEHSNEQLDQDPNLSDLVRNEGVSCIRERLSPANCLLLPTRYEVSSSLGHTFGFVELRLYDLNTGQLVYSANESINVNQAGIYAERHLTAVLVGFTYNQFEANYLKRLGSSGR